MYAVYAVYAVYDVCAVYAVYALYAVYAVYDVYDVYAVYGVYAVYDVYAVYAVYALYALYAVYAVCLSPTHKHTHTYTEQVAALTGELRCTILQFLMYVKNTSASYVFVQKVIYVCGCYLPYFVEVGDTANWDRRFAIHRGR